LIADSTKAKEVLDWEAEYSLDKIIKTAWSWHEKEAGNTKS
jgi:UDP-glucose 4-epimerase